MALINAAAEGRVMIVEGPSGPVRAPSSGGAVFSDGFSDPDSGWDVGSTENVRLSYAEGAYEVEVIPEKFFATASAPADVPADVILAADVRVRTPAGDGDMGLMCRVQDSGDFYALEVSEDGYFSIWKYINEETSMLLDWTQLSSVPSGATLALSAACIGNRLTLMADGVVLGEATDNELSEGYAGVIAGTWDNGGLRVAFDNFQAREPGAQASTSGNVLFADDFSSTDSGWDRHSDEQVVTDYAQGGYRIWVNETQSDVWANPGISVDDAVIEVDATTTAGPLDNDLGVLCRYQDADNFYMFEISSDGFAIIAKYSAGEWTGLTGDGMQPTDAIVQGKTTNHLRVECVGSSLRLYVNSTLVAEVSDDTFASGSVGLIAGTFDEPGTDILFDNFKVLRP
jgi:hypothetical protein